MSDNRGANVAMWHGVARFNPVLRPSSLQNHQFFQQTKRLNPAVLPQRKQQNYLIMMEVPSKRDASNELRWFVKPHVLQYFNGPNGIPGRTTLF